MSFDAADDLDDASESRSFVIDATTALAGGGFWIGSDDRVAGHSWIPPALVGWEIPRASWTREPAFSP